MKRRIHNDCDCWCGCLKCGRRGVATVTVMAMYADYKSGMNFCQVGKKHGGRTGGEVRAIFERRKFKLRPCLPQYDMIRTSGGFFRQLKPKSAREISKLIAGLKTFRLPDGLKNEWRRWTLKKRAAFISRLRRKFKNHDTRPATPFSRNLTPFDYTTPRAHEIMARDNVGLPSQKSKYKLRLASCGVIFEDQLWNWMGHPRTNSATGYVSGDTRSINRKILHHEIWERKHGRKVPPAHVVIFRDGNKNNFTPGNLQLKHRREVAEENKIKSQQRKGAARTNLLLGHYNDCMAGHAQIYLEKEAA